MTVELPTGTVTFLFTDIEGSTRLWERFPEPMRAALTRHDELLREIVEAHAGRIVKTTGDGAYAVFGRAADALAAALAAQVALLAENARPDRFGGLPEDLKVRMGLNTGEAEAREGDYHGTALNRAARLMSAGHGGQILLSAVTASVAESALPAGATLRDMGEHRLPGLARPERLYQVVAPSLPNAFPPLRSLGEYIVSLPTPATSFIGRDDEVRRLVGLLGDPSIRLLSLVGPGGAGKTRLAIQAAGDLARNVYRADHAEGALGGADRFLDGIYFVPLAPLNTPESMVSAVAQAVGFRFRQSDEPPRRQLLDFLRRKHLLLVLDNLEHLLPEGGADLPAELLAESPGIGLLATSRTRLNVQGEHLFPVGGMIAPDPLTVRRWQTLRSPDIETEAANYSAVRLFCQSAARVRPGFRLGRDNVLDVARICRQVEGLPLGIELAAAWLEALSLPEIAAEIEHSLDILATEQRGVSDRQRSIRAVFDTSWQLLSDRERAILPMLSVFRGGFAREAAEFVAAASLRDLRGLVNKSWLQVNDEARTTNDERQTTNPEPAAGADRSELVARRSSPIATGGRFQLHELLRQYAEEKLREMPDLEVRARDRASRYYARFLESTMRRMIGPEQVRALDAVAEEFDDIRAAWRWWVEQGAFERLVDQMLLPLFLYATARFVGSDVGPLIDEAIVARRSGGAGAQGRGGEAATDQRPTTNNQQPDALLAALLIARMAVFEHYMTGEFGMGDIRPAWEIAEALGDDAPRRLGVWYGVLCLFAGYQIEMAPAVARLRAFVAGAAADEWALAVGRQSLARLLAHEFAPEADLLEARRLVDEAVTIFERMGNRDACAVAYSDQAMISTMLGRFDEGHDFLDRAQPLAEAVGNWGLVWQLLLSRREMFLQQGEPERMFPVFDEMLAMSRRVGNYRLEAWTLSWDSIYALRYHSVERALAKRQAAAVVAEEFGLAYDAAWSTFELGEIQRVRGDVAAAWQWYERSLPLFEQAHEPMGAAFHRRGLGDLALLRGEWEAADGHFRAYLAWS
ncbi:adenylate/guanylate cyclase domain-containing protein, partial [Promineifilum sp.]|uniref:adenylate/guanylate cyclase domain-containing protein n=1 Tax=Promineifilum sp. TaxID=2664178 RepID=UPI0035AF3505